MKSNSKTLASATALLFMVALIACVCRTPRQAVAAPLPNENGQVDDLAELNQRITKLEAEVAEVRKALWLAGGALDKTTEIKKVREVAKLRAADLLQRSQNAHSLVHELRKGKLAGQSQRETINDLNNSLSDLWITLAGYGLGTEPYTDHVRVSASGFGRGKPAPDYGIPGSYVGIGLPRLYEHFLEASGAKEPAVEKAVAEFKKLVQPYSDPAIYPHREFYERAYGEYRNGQGLAAPQFETDLKALDQWFSDLEAALGKVPACFDKAP